MDVTPDEQLADTLRRTCDTLAGLADTVRTNNVDPNTVNHITALIDEVDTAISTARTALAHSHRRWMAEAAGMADEPDWFDNGGPYEHLDDTWNIDIVDDDERYPAITVDAPDAFEAKRRAVTWAVIERNLNEALPVDSPRLRLAGKGVHETAPERWHVTVEGW